MIDFEPGIEVADIPLVKKPNSNISDVFIYTPFNEPTRQTHTSSHRDARYFRPHYFVNTFIHHISQKMFDKKNTLEKMTLKIKVILK